MSNFETPSSMDNISDQLINIYLYQTYEDCRKKYPGSLPKRLYSLSEDGKVMSNISQALSGPLVIPDGIETVVFKGSYSNEELTALILPDSVKEMKGSINGYFCKSLEFIRLSPNMSLPKEAFADCPLKAVLIPEGIKAVPEESFSDNDLIELRLPESLEFIMKGAFRNNKRLEEIVIPRNVKVIMPGAFEGCNKLKKVTVISPETIIFPGAFSYCKELGEEVEKDLYEKHKVGDREIGADKVLYAKEKSTVFHNIVRKTVKSKVLKYVPDYFCGELVIEDGTNKADYDGANLRNIEGITKLYIPDSMVENIPSLPPHVKEVRFPESMEGLDEFRCSLDINSDSLISFNFPKGLRKLKISNAQLTELEIPESVKEVEIRNMPKLKRLVLPSSLKSIEISDLPLLDDLRIPEGIKELRHGFGTNCHNLKNVTLPDRLETIGENAFYGCENLTSIIIPPSVTEIKCGAFSQCPGLTEVTMEGKPKINPEAFEDTPGYEVKTTGLASMVWNEDGLPVVEINLTWVYCHSYYYAMSEDDEGNRVSMEWGDEGVLLISKTRDLKRFPFDKTVYVDGSELMNDEVLSIFSDEYEVECIEALTQSHIFYQETDETFSEEIWENTARAIAAIFKPHHYGVRPLGKSLENKEYEGPEAIFHFKIFDRDDYERGYFDETDKNLSPFFEARYRVFKNQNNEWTSEKLD